MEFSRDELRRAEALAQTNGRAVTKVVGIGRRNSRRAEVISGLAAHDRVIVHPIDRIVDGVGLPGAKPAS